MGSLSNLYVSQSYQSLLHLGTDSSFFPVGASPVQGYVTVQDGLGYNAGFAISSSGAMFFSQSIIVDKNLSVNQNLDVDGNLIISGTFDIEGKVTVNDNVRINGNLEVSGATTLTGSLAISNAITASNMFITNDLIVSGTISAFKIVTTIESASVIFSSGSNILGDNILDTQTLNGSIIMSGSSSLTGSMGITGNLNVLGNGNFGGTGSFIGDLTATGNISSSTISGIGNVTTFSQSVDSRLDFLEGPFSTSVDLRLDQLEAFSSSLQADFATQTELTQTASFLQNQINQKLNTSSFNAYTQSYSASVAVTTTDITNRINTLASFTGSYATTGSNNFIGNQTITGSLILSSSAAVELSVIGNSIFSGSVRGQVVSLSISSTTASMDLSLGNFFTITLNTAGAVRIEPTNIQPGETITLRLTQPAGGYSSVVFPTNVDYPSGYEYTATPAANAIDVITFVTFDTSSLYYSRANQFI
jgi:cytoskeletal protein CcmA (bactofilin family)